MTFTSWPPKQARTDDRPSIDHPCHLLIRAYINRRYRDSMGLIGQHGSYQDCVEGKQFFEPWCGGMCGNANCRHGEFYEWAEMLGITDPEGFKREMRRRERVNGNGDV